MQAFASECDWYDRLSHCMQGSNPFLENVPGLHGTALKLQIYSLAFISMQRAPFKADKNRCVGPPPRHIHHYWKSAPDELFINLTV